MWARRTFQECAAELEQTSRRFRAAHTGEGVPPGMREQEKREASKDGLEVLRHIVLAIRSEQDNDWLPRPGPAVGVIKNGVAKSEIEQVMAAAGRPADEIRDSVQLQLREGLNKIAHPDFSRTSFYADAEHHDLVLAGQFQGREWVAVISIPLVCDVLRDLPHRELPPRRA